MSVSYKLVTSTNMQTNSINGIHKFLCTLSNIQQYFFKYYSGVRQWINIMIKSIL